MYKFQKGVVFLGPVYLRDLERSRGGRHFLGGRRGMALPEKARELRVLHEDIEGLQHSHLQEELREAFRRDCPVRGLK